MYIANLVHDWPYVEWVAQLDCSFPLEDVRLVIPLEFKYCKWTSKLWKSLSVCIVCCLCFPTIRSAH